MAATIDTGMDKGDMKRLLMKSKKEPVSCAIGQGDDVSTGLLLLDKVKAPKAVEKDLAKQFPDARNTRWGTAVVDVEEDPKTVLFYINKPISSMAKKLVKTLKGTGFSKVKILLEDGSSVEDFDEEQAGAVPPAPPGAPSPQPQAAPAQSAAPAAPPPPPAPQAAAEQPPAPPQAAAAAEPPAASPAAADTGPLTQALTGLVKRLAQADPSQQGRLKGLAQTAQAGIKAGDVPGAETAIEQLRAALDAVAPAAATSTNPPVAPPAPAPFVKARTAWLATRQKVETDIGKLQTTFASAFKDHDMAAELEKAFQTRVEKVLVGLDVELAHKLDAVSKATDAAQHAKLVGEARQIMQRYQAFVDSDPTLTELDANPFVPLAIQKTLTATLTVLSKTLA